MSTFAGEPSTSEFPNNYGVNDCQKDFDGELNSDLAYEIIGAWYYTSNDYNFAVEPSSNDADAFTQIVWKNTTSLGVDVEVIGNKLYVTVVYYPAGNKRNEYVANVGYPKNWNEVVFNNSDLEVFNFVVSKIRRD